jgi:ATP-binding cassette subfamily C protein
MVDARAIAWVEGWLGQLGTVLSHIATPAIQVRAEGQGTIFSEQWSDFPA